MRLGLEQDARFLRSLADRTAKGDYSGLAKSPSTVKKLVSLYEEKGQKLICAKDLNGLKRLAQRTLPDPYYFVLYLAAMVNSRLRKKNDKCGSFYADVRPCSEDCSFCPLSKFHYYGVQRAKKSSWKELPSEIYRYADRIYRLGVRHFKIVTTGAKTDPRIIPYIAESVRKIKRDFADLTVCISEGTLDVHSLRRLREAGVEIFNNNLETSRARFPSLVSSHSYKDKIRAIRAAQAVGLKVCSGGLFGIGESLGERAELFMTLAKLGVYSSPFNLFVRFPALPLTRQVESQNYALSKRELAYSVALFRLINPKARLVLGAGRSDQLSEKDEAFLLLVGATSLASSGYLTRRGLIFSTKRDEHIFRKVEM